MKTVLRSASAVALASLALSVRATLLDFEGLSGGTDGGGILLYPSPIATKGYLVAATGGLDVLEPSSVSYGFNYTGSAAVFSDDAVPIFVSRFGGGTFDLLSLDVANLEPPASAGVTQGVVVFTGFLASGGTVTRTYTVPLNTALNTVSFTGFTGLASFSIDDSQSPGLPGQYDNIVVNATPEPSALAALGLGALGVLRRRRRA